MNEKEIVRLYVEEKWTLRQIADLMASNHHRIKKILLVHEVEITKKGRRHIPFTLEHRRKIGEKSLGRVPKNKGIPATEIMIRKYIQVRMRTGIDLDQFENLQKLQFLIKVTSRHYEHLGVSDDTRETFLQKFYNCASFNAIFDAWILHDKNMWWRPSIDHINPKANGGTFDLDNLQFLTWFENRAKADMLADEWQQFKQDTGTKSSLFIEEILANYKH